MTNKPFKEFRDGLLKVTVWKNDRYDGGRSFYSYDLRRSYKDEADVTPVAHPPATGIVG